MSAEDVENLRAVYVRLATGDLRAGLELLDPDIEVVPSAPGASPTRGLSAYLGFVAEFLEQWSDFRVEADELIDAPAGVLVAERQHGLGRHSGVETTQRFYVLWTFRDGRVVRLQWINDRAAALARAGLPS